MKKSRLLTSIINFVNIKHLATIFTHYSQYIEYSQYFEHDKIQQTISKDLLYDFLRAVLEHAE